MSSRSQQPEDVKRRVSLLSKTKKDLEHHAPLTVVLTGGPSSGKSTALAILKDRFFIYCKARGLQVLTVPENATHIMSNSDGFQSYWAGTQQQVEMQRIFMEFQMDQEKAFREFAKLNRKRSIMLLDRSLIDTRVFISDEQYQCNFDQHQSYCDTIKVALLCLEVGAGEKFSWSTNVR